MNNRFLIGAGLSLFTMAILAKDPVIMTVNGEKVPKSEFEYLYHKNRQQQITPQPLEEYVEMFKLYKLKVADAKAAGIDTSASFRKEMAQYRRELSQPYLTDSLFLYKLIEEAAQRGREEVEVSHIMLAKHRSENENLALKAQLDSIRTEILSGADFGEMAKQYSVDRGSASRGGYMGYIGANRYPYSFEIAAYNLPEGAISEIVESPVGYHLIKTGKRRASSGKIHASHIMKMIKKNDSPEDKKRAKNSIDSIYSILKADPSKFASLAKTESDDKGSAMKGGELPWFGLGEMVPEFETAAFALEEGEISEPVESQYGWHIIMVDGHKGAPGVEDLKPELLQRMQSPQDERWELIRRHNDERLASKHKAVVDQQTLDVLKSAASNGIDSVFMEGCLYGPLSDMTLVEIDKQKKKVNEFAATLKEKPGIQGEAAIAKIEKSVDNWKSKLLTEAELEWLYDNEPDYRNLLKEYHDGSLLYEVSLQKVWDKASKDKEGLKKYFEKNKENYTWTKPHAKGILVQAQNDSVANLIRERMDALPGDSILPAIRKEYKGKALIERFLVERGANGMVDHILFGAPKAEPAGSYKVYFLYNPRILNKPEEINDVRGAVTSDYQTELENEWIEELRRKYPVEVNTKELKKVK